MITDEEIKKIFEWADEFEIIGKSVNSHLKWGIDVKDNEKIRRGIPRDKELLLKLTHLNLTGYGATKRFEIRYIPSELCKLTNLKWIDLSYNFISYLPINFSNLINLEFLNISLNALENLNNIENHKLKHLIIDDISISKDFVTKCPKIELIEILNSKTRKDNIKRMSFYYLGYNKDIGILVRTPNIEKPTKPTPPKPNHKKPFKNFLYKGDK